jgi:membrane protein implicated in regulation of membrane protease activity
MPDAPLEEQPPRQPVVTASRVIAGVCLAAPLVALLWVGSYARLTPRFIGIPFFYWYQMAWVPVSAVLTYTAYVLVRREERGRKGGAAK